MALNSVKTCATDTWTGRATATVSLCFSYGRYGSFKYFYVLTSDSAIIITAIASGTDTAWALPTSTCPRQIYPDVFGAGIFFTFEGSQNRTRADLFLESLRCLNRISLIQHSLAL